MNALPSKSSTAGRLSSTLLFGLAAVILVICIVYAPSEAFKASGQGLAIWWRIVFPALLPFLVLTEIVLASGFVRGLGVLLEPFTRRILGLPGLAGYVIPLGLIAGFPAAAATAASLYQQGKVTSKEAERMAAAAHFGSPMLLTVVIGTGFIGSPALGLLLLGIHWLAGFGTAVTLRRGGTIPDSSSRFRSSSTPSVNKGILHLVFSEMRRAQEEDGRSFGKLLGDAVSKSVQTLMNIGGYILIFAVVIHVLTRAWPSFLSQALLSGLLELHLGTYTAAKMALPPSLLAAWISALLGWGGLCALLQVRSILYPAGIGIRSFILYRMIHAAYACLLALLLWKPVMRWFPGTLPAASGISTASVNSDIIGYTLLPTWEQIGDVLRLQSLLLAAILAGSICIALLLRRRKVR